MSDLIDRDAALNQIIAIDTSIIPYFRAREYVDETKNYVIKIIETLPSAGPERTAKVIEHDASVTDTDGYKYHRSEYLCGACKYKVLLIDVYCSHCGARLEWRDDE